MQLYVVQKLNKDVSHIIIGERLTEVDLRPSETKGRHLVSSDWIGKCIDEGKLLEERQFVPLTFSFVIFILSL